MKNKTAKKMKKLCWVLLLLITVCLFAVGCGQSVETTLEETTQAPDTTAGAALEGGFETGGCEVPTIRCAFRSTQTEFDINDVTLTFFYGGWYYDDIEYQRTFHDVPYFEIYFKNDSGKKILVKKVEENFISEKYKMDYLYDAQWNYLGMEFNHSETLTIPAEMFEKDHGIIWFSILGEDLKDPDQIDHFLTGTSIYYKVVDNTVMLSYQAFK